MVVAGAISPPLLESPSNTPSPMSPYASQDSLLADFEDEEGSNREGEPHTGQSATAAILGAITPSEVKARSYLYGGLDSLFGPRELDQCLPDRAITLFIATWNMNGKEPPGFLDDFHLGEQLNQEPDMYVIGTQESGAERKTWEVRLQCMIGQKHVLLTSAVLGILHLNIFVRRDLIWFCSLPEESSHSLRPGTYFKTKGAIAIAFQFFGTRLLFINSHLFAHEEKYAQRLQNIKNISHALDLPRSLPVKHKHKDITKRFDCVFWLGDMNFRLVANRDHVLEKLQAGVQSPGTVQHLLQWDQLSCAKKKGETFLDYEEGEITFAPTFKFDPGTDNYDSSSKQRVPSYTDRILFKSPRSSVSCLEYDACTVFRTSDHKPVWGRFLCKIRPGKDDVPHNAGAFNRDVFVDALKRRRKQQQQHQRREEGPEGGCGIQ